VGTSFAKGLAISCGIPLIAVNHMEAHVLAHFIEPPFPKFPFICLTISGGHTQLVLVKDYLDMTILGQTKDDAVGEAFDKTAKLLGFPYPGGPYIDRHAQKGDPQAFAFPKTEVPGLDYSFSGIKTAVLYFLRDHVKHNPDFIKQRLDDICASVQHTLIEMLFKKLIAASEQHQVDQIAIAGGVSANSGVRSTLQEMAAHHSWQAYIPAFEYCTDNAAMIAQTALFKYQNQIFVDLNEGPDPRMKFGGSSK